jgi:uncharacterized protein involved in outer membrane biogenesis
MRSRRRHTQPRRPPGSTGRILKIGAAGLLVVLVVAMAAVYVASRAISVEYLRAFLQTETSALIGRELTIAGELRLNIFSLRPGVQADDVRLGNAAWSSQRDMVHVSRLDVEIDLLALFAGTIRIDRFNLLQPEILIETDRQGRGNWVFEERRVTSAAPGADVPPYALDIREVRVANGRVLYRNGATGRAHQFDLARLKIRSPTAEDPLSIDLAATVNGRSFTLVGSVGSLVDLHVRRQPLPLEFTARAGEARATLTGAVAQPFELAGIDVRVLAEGDEFAEFLRYAGIETPALGRYRLSGRLSGSARALAARDVELVVGDPERTGARLQGEIRDVLGLAGVDFIVSARVADPKTFGKYAWPTAPALPPLKLQGRVTQSRTGYAIRDLNVRFGESSLTGTAAIAPRTPRLKLTAQLAGPLVDLHELVPWLGAEPPVSKKKDERLFSDEPLSLGWFGAIDLDLKLQARRLVRAVGKELYAVNAHLVLADGKLFVDPLRLKLSPDGNALSVRLRAHATPAGKLDVHASARGAAIELAHLRALVGNTASVSGAPTDVKLDVHATGGSVRELMAGLNGEAVLVVGAGRLEERSLDWGSDLLTRFFILANPFAKDKPYTALECAVVRLPASDGVVTVNRSIALETEKVSIVASGIVDLRRETIELYAQTRAREGLGLGSGTLANMYQIEGALAAPSLGLSGKGLRETGISAGAAVGTAGVSLLVERLLLTDREPCRTALGPASVSK